MWRSGFHGNHREVKDALLDVNVSVTMIVIQTVMDASKEGSLKGTLKEIKL